MGNTIRADGSSAGGKRRKEMVYAMSGERLDRRVPQLVSYCDRTSGTLKNNEINFRTKIIIRIVRATKLLSYGSRAYTGVHDAVRRARLSENRLS